MKNFLKLASVMILFGSLTSCTAYGSYGMGLPGGGTVVISTGGPVYGGYGGRQQRHPEPRHYDAGPYYDYGYRR